MKKILFPIIWITLFIGFILFASRCHAALFGIDGTLFKQEMNKTNNELSAIKVQGDISAAKIDKLQVTLNANLDAIAGVNNTIQKTSVGRDMTTTNTNDSKLMGIIIKGLVGLCSTLIGILGWCLKTLIRTSTEKKFYKEKTLIHIKNADELKALKEEQKNYIKTNGFRKRK